MRCTLMLQHEANARTGMAREREWEEGTGSGEKKGARFSRKPEPIIWHANITSRR